MRGYTEGKRRKRQVRGGNGKGDVGYGEDSEGWKKKGKKEGMGKG